MFRKWILPRLLLACYTLAARLANYFPSCFVARTVIEKRNGLLWKYYDHVIPSRFILLTFPQVLFFYIIKFPLHASMLPVWRTKRLIHFARGWKIRDPADTFICQAVPYQEINRMSVKYYRYILLRLCSFVLCIYLQVQSLVRLR